MRELDEIKPKIAVLCFDCIRPLGFRTYIDGGRDDAASLEFDRDVKPIPADYCFGCHADGANEGSMSFDTLLALDDREQSNEKWHRVLRQLQSGLMPPPGEDRPDSDQVAVLKNWIKYGAFGLDPENPDPGRVTVRRLNQIEYRNSIRDLIGVDYDTSSNFPADDTGHGFDNIGDVLSLSPLLLEKYVNAAKEIVTSAAPLVSGVVREASLAGDQFKLDLADLLNSVPNDGEDEQQPNRPAASPDTTELSYYEAATARAKLKVTIDGDYVLRLNINAKETYVDNQFDENKCEFSFGTGNEVLLKREFVRQGSKDFSFDFEREFTTGEYDLFAAIKPLSNDPQIRRLRIRIKSVDLIGPQDEKHFAKLDGHERFFPRDVPDSEDGTQSSLTAGRRPRDVVLTRPHDSNDRREKVTKTKATCLHRA